MKNKNIVITGGSGILLSPIAKECANLGANVLIVGIKERDKKYFGHKNIRYKKCNVLDEQSVKELGKYIEAEYKTIDVLINGAGGNHPKATTQNEIFNIGDVENPEIQSFFDMEIENFRWVNELNFLSAVITSKYLTKYMLKNGGNILNVSSMSSPKPMTKVPAYSAAKASVDNFTKWMCVHFAKSDIRVNSIAPGFFLTKQNEKLLLNEDGSLTERSGKIITHTPMGRFGTPEDLIEPIMFLINDSKSEFITGITLEVDGGFSAYAGV